ncbi:hypothetical protein [Luteibacter sp.]|jgi:hypothetical protein|uniref:hypothetical protein n=1 Tax=Luteibacter sp. TaxID=1886636 RepID=UPI002F3FA22D
MVRIGSNLPFVEELDKELDAYWKRTRSSWPVTARYQFVRQARRAFAKGVKRGLENLRDGKWNADRGSIDHADAVITGDVFEDMREQTERRWRSDARMEVRTVWDAYRVATRRIVSLLAPVGFVRPLAIPVQAGSALAGLGTGIEQAIHGRTADARRSGLGDGVMAAVTNVPLGAAFGGVGTAEPGGGTDGFKLPQTVNGRIGYPLSPIEPRGDGEEGIYRTIAWMPVRRSSCLPREPSAMA